MIKNSGKVIITKDAITITDFCFDGVDMPCGQIEALDWAIKRLRYAKEEALEFLKEHEKKRGGSGVANTLGRGPRDRRFNPDPSPQNK